MLTIDHQPTPRERTQVVAWLRTCNHQHTPHFMNALESGDEKIFFLAAKNAKGEVTGGLRGSHLLDWLKINVVAVHPAFRKQGIGRALMEEAESFGVRKGCRHAYLDTMSYQAPKFYLGLGYQEAGRLVNWDSNGHDKILYTKDLPTAGNG